jgi:hypothetical protein
MIYAADRPSASALRWLFLPDYNGNATQNPNCQQVYKRTMSTSETTNKY